MLSHLFCLSRKERIHSFKDFSQLVNFDNEKKQVRSVVKGILFWILSVSTIDDDVDALFCLLVVEGIRNILNDLDLGNPHGV